MTAVLERGRGEDEIELGVDRFLTRDRVERAGLN